MRIVGRSGVAEWLPAANAPPLVNARLGALCQALLLLPRNDLARVATSKLARMRGADVLVHPPLARPKRATGQARRVPAGFLSKAPAKRVVELTRCSAPMHCTVFRTLAAASMGNAALVGYNQARLASTSQATRSFRRLARVGEPASRCGSALPQ